jgi:uncharacterized protein YciI
MNETPLRRQTIVPAGADEAFRVFTERIGEWWPRPAAFRDGTLAEVGPDGATGTLLGTVITWEPPRLVALDSIAGRVEVSFEPVTDALTMVTVTHTGWEIAASREDFERGWPGVVASFAAVVRPAESAGDELVWLVLQHTAGVDRPMEHPGFAGHRAFLGSLQERGLLVAAGPFPGSDGEGMTIVRVPASSAAELLAEANHGDTSVAGGVLEVRVRPWVVVLRGSSLP